MIESYTKPFLRCSAGESNLYIYELVYVFYWDKLNAQNGGKKFDLLMSKVAGKDRQIKNGEEKTLTKRCIKNKNRN